MADIYSLGASPLTKTGVKKLVLIIVLVGLLIVVGLFGLGLLDKKLTTTPDEYMNTLTVNAQTYSNDKTQVIKTVDSLLAVEVIYKPADKALRYFDGKTFEDTVARQWAIDLPMKNVKYLEHIVDTMFYNPTDNSEFAGLLISKMNNRLAKNGIEYFGNGFLCKRAGQTIQLVISGHRVTGAETREQCSEFLHDIYFRKMGLIDSSFNLNDKRFWTSRHALKVTWE